MFVNVDIESKELSMTAYHYYFMYFTYFLIHPPPGVVWPASLADVLYTQLVEDYLHFFLPPGEWYFTFAELSAEVEILSRFIVIDCD